jgi:hypothetical protein
VCSPRSRSSTPSFATIHEGCAPTSLISRALDLLGTIEENTGFDELVADSEWLEIGDLRVRVLSLVRLIRVKEQLGRPKDKAMLLILRATLDEKQRG